MFIAACVLVSSVIAPAQLMAAGFDCKKASTAMEKKICSDKTLDQMDTLLSDMYRRAYRNADNKEAVKTAQLEWLQQRNQVCAADKTGEACERLYIDAYQRLIPVYYSGSDKPAGDTLPADAALANLMQGMTLPDDSTLSEISASALETEKGTYRPWPRKPLLKLPENAGVAALAAGTFKDVLYIYYAQRDGQTINLYEYNTSTRDQRLLNTSEGGDWDYQTSLLLVRNGHVFFTRDGGEVRPPEEGTNLMLMPVGARSAPRLVSDSEFRQYRPVLSNKRSHEVSENGQWLVAFYNALKYDSYSERDTFGSLSDITDYARRDPAMLTRRSAFYIYDRFNDRGYSPEIGLSPRGWAIDSFVLHPQKPLVFFDNSGGMACIWEYNMESGELFKIVPEHLANTPAVVNMNGQDFIVFVLKDSSFSHQSLYLAARP
tara:strand:+ start:1674 stop:2969 length:1296 start_codon:yes stop_codon:yes gene_type:complete